MTLTEKYNIPVPRYTSYPTVPAWDNTPSLDRWMKIVKDSFRSSNSDSGISIYIHLPYCESLCTYCACNTRITVNHAVERPYVDAVIKEWKIYRKLFDQKPMLKDLHLGGGTPTFFSADNLEFLIKNILDDCTIDPNSEFSFEAHPANTKKEHLQKLFELGFKRISFGIQDFDSKVQEAINRYQTLEDVKKVVDQARHIGYHSVNFDLVYGLPFQTLESIRETINQILFLLPERIAFYSYAHVPWLKPGQRKFTEKDLPLKDEKRQLYQKGRSLFMNAGYVEIGMDHFALKTDPLYKAAMEGKLHRNFMGYTNCYSELLIGLGVSAISDAWLAFSQNKKTVEDYLESLNNDCLPNMKGHVLSSTDLIIRKHILNLMCHFKTSWNDPRMRIPELIGIIYRLKELEKDGLVRVEDDCLVVTNEGRSFIRNICLCFDLRYWETIPKKNVFSASI